MNETVLASFLDELEKIATTNVVTSKGSALGKPAPVSTGPNVAKQIGAASKSPVKPTNYTVVHNQSPVAATETAAGIKAAPPPPVRV